jgi:hypothetical protein
VPKLPSVYGFEGVTGRTHQRCLKTFGRNDELRSAIARSLAAFVGAHETKTIDFVADGTLAIHSDQTRSFDVWNLADFVEFTVIDEVIPSIQAAAEDEEVELSPGGLHKLEIGSDGRLSLVTTSSSSASPMPSLSLDSLRALLTRSGAVERADSMVRLGLGSTDVDITEPTVGWFQTRTSETSIPVLLRPFNDSPAPGELLFYLTGLDPTLDLSRLGDGQVLSIRIDEETEFEATVTESQALFAEPAYVDNVPGAGRTARQAIGG